MDMVGLLTNKNKLVDTVKEHIPTVLDQLTAQIGAQCGADAAQPIAVVLFKADTGDGTTTMARVHTVDAFGDLGEELGTIDLPEAIRRMPNELITSKLPW